VCLFYEIQKTGFQYCTTLFFLIHRENVDNFNLVKDLSQESTLRLFCSLSSSEKDVRRVRWYVSNIVSGASID